MPPTSGMVPTANVGRIVTREMATRWASALSELENAIMRARKRGAEEEANRAAEHAALASDMVPRIERASRAVADLQAEVDRLEAQGREFRANLGHALDVLVRDRSRERAHLEALRIRSEALIMGPPSGGNLDARAWEEAALVEEEARAKGVVDDLGFQVQTLTKELDKRNEDLDRDLVVATGTLEGSLSALRSLQSELVRTIDEGIAHVTASEKATQARR
jgi:hypothetical protein